MKKSDVKVLLFALGIVIAVMTYFFVYTKLNEKTDVYNAENATLQSEVDKLQDLADHKEQYLQDTETMNARMDEIKQQFAASYLPEDEILYVDNIEKSFDASARTVGMPGSAQVTVEAPQQVDTPASDTTEDGDETEDATAESTETAETAPSAASSIQLYQTPVSIGFVTSYNSIKDIIKTMNEDQMRKSIESLSLAFDSETGDLAGSMNFNMYSLTGTDAEYAAPTVNGVTFGTNNIFNSADKKAAINAEKTAEKAAEEETKSEE